MAFKISSLLLIKILIAQEVLCRGPHHPRGGRSRHHMHYQPMEHGTGNMMQDSQLIRDTEHIQEDLGEWARDKDLSALSEEELEFYYFQIHDFDKNSKLDGLEILRAIQHISEHAEPLVSEEEKKEHPEAADLGFFIEMIDRVLEEDDADQDGFLSYPEYVAGRQKESLANWKEVPPVPPAVSIT